MDGQISTGEIHGEICRIHAVSSSVGVNRKREIVMKYLRLIAAALAVFTLSACVGVIFPIPLPGSTTTQDADRNERQ
jgi:hypothetical protein